MAVHAETRSDADAVVVDPTVQPTWFATIRAFAVMVGLPILLHGLTLASLIVTALGWTKTRSNCRGRPVGRWFALIGAVAPAIYWFGARPWLARWGAEPAEIAQSLPGDELVPDPGLASTRAITINAPVEAVWPWLAQIGQDRGGFYTYAWLENLAGCHMRNADSIHPEWQRREIGEVVKLHPATGLKVARFEPNRALALGALWGFTLEPLDANRTRLIARTRTARGWPALLYALFIDLPHFIMERQMLIGIKSRAEGAWGAQAPPT